MYKPCRLGCLLVRLLQPLNLHTVGCTKARPWLNALLHSSSVCPKVQDALEFMLAKSCDEWDVHADREQVRREPGADSRKQSVQIEGGKDYLSTPSQAAHVKGGADNDRLRRCASLNCHQLQVLSSCSITRQIIQGSIEQSAPSSSLACQILRTVNYRVSQMLEQSLRRCIRAHILHMSCEAGTAPE